MRWEIALVAVPFAVGLATVLACAWKRGGDKAPKKVGPPGWDFNKSWATNITVLGSVFGTVWSNSVVPNPPKLVSSLGYPMLAIAFAIAALVAPIVFIGLGSIKTVYKGGTSDIQYQGTSLGFGVAMLLTLSAALGQAATLIAISVESLLAGHSPEVAWSTIAVLLMGALGMIVYACRTARQFLRHQKKWQDDAATRRNTMKKALNRDLNAEEDPTNEPLPGWSLL